MRMNSSNHSQCSSEVIPSISAYLSATNVYGAVLLATATLAVISILAMFADTLRYIMRNSTSGVKAQSAFVIAVYPIVALATYFAILVPRAHLIAEALTQGAFMIAMYQLFCLFVAYCDGEARLVKKAKTRRLNLRVVPCCCWPCCFFLPSPEVTKDVLQRLRILILQLPVVQVLVYLTLLVMWAERQSLYQINYMYLQPLIITSIIFGLWGMTVTINLLEGLLGEEFVLRKKFNVLKFVLIFAKLQGLVTRILVWTNALPCNPPITPAVYANLLHNTLMLAEMVMLGFIARRLYKRTLPLPENNAINISTIGTIMATDLSQNNNESPKDLNFNIISSLNGEKMGQVNAAVDISE